MSSDQELNKYSSDELIPPSFLTEEYFQGVVRTIEEDPDLKLLHFCTSPGSGAGDHYASVVQKITASYETKANVKKDQKYFLKTLPDDGKKQELLSEMPLFVNELRMYKEVLPEMERILKENGEEKWWPSLLYSSEKPLVLLFNDVSSEGFEVARDKCNMQEIQLLIEQIAKYHALSMILIQEGTLDLNFTNVYGSAGIRDLLSPMKANLPLFGSIIKTWKGFEKIGEKMEDAQFGEEVLQNMLHAVTGSESWGIEVLNHGDFHIRNMLFRVKAGEKKGEALFIDFQVPIRNSPALDLNTMLQLSSNYEVRERKDEVLFKYHRMLVENLKAFGFKGKLPSAIDVQVEMLRSSSVELYQILCLVPIVLIPDLKILDAMENGNSTNEGLVNIYKDIEFIDHMKTMLRSLVNRGLFD